MANFLLYIFLANFIRWYIQTNHIFDRIFFTPLLDELRKCTKCLGWWCFIALYPIFQPNVFNEITPLTILLSIVIVPAILSIGSYYLIKGWATENTTVYIKG